MIRAFQLLICLLVTVAANTVFAQNEQPSVASIIEEHDADSDGQLSAQEVKDTRFARSFSQWDANRDGTATSDEIVAYRKRLGINSDGTVKDDDKDKGNDENKAEAAIVKMLPIPEVDELPQVSRNKRANRAARRNSAFVLQTDEHAVSGTRYVILTDHKDKEYLDSLRRLSDHHKGIMIQVDDLATLHQDDEGFEKLRKQLIDEKAKWVAIAPRKESFRENMLLGAWKLLSTLDDDPQIDVFPGVLLSSSAESFAKLVDQSIAHQPQSPAFVKPFAICQVQKVDSLRSLQKGAIVRKLFAEKGLETPIVGVYGTRADNAPRLEGEKTWNVKLAGRKKFVKEFPADVSESLNESNLIVMHGHGVPGMSCSVDNAGLPTDMAGKILFSGSCFSASPTKSDLPRMRRAPGGYDVQPRDAFIVRAIDNGAVMAFGHQRLSSGFPHLFPVLQGVLEGKSAGQAYQELLNGLIDWIQIDSNEFVVDNPGNSRRIPQNRLLYVLIGDPALQPFAK